MSLAIFVHKIGKNISPSYSLKKFQHTTLFLITSNTIPRRSRWIFYIFGTLTVNRFSGLTSIMPRSKFWQSGGTKCGMWKTPFFTFSNSWRKLSSSNGSAPTSSAYSITPHDQTSAFRPSYFSPWKSSFLVQTT